MNPTENLKARHKRYPKVAMLHLLWWTPLWGLSSMLLAGCRVLAESWGLYKLLRLQIRINRKRRAR